MMMIMMMMMMMMTMVFDYHGSSDLWFVCGNTITHVVCKINNQRKKTHQETVQRRNPATKVDKEIHSTKTEGTQATVRSANKVTKQWMQIVPTKIVVCV